MSYKVAFIRKSLFKRMLKISFVSLLSILIFSSAITAKDISDIESEVTKIVTNLHNANGNFIYGGAPKVVVNEEKGAGAAYNPKLHILYLDLEVYNICMTYGKQHHDALAFVLGHELAHCYMEHYIFSNFNQYQKCNGSEMLFEKNADVYGLFNAYLAGYHSYKIVPTLIDQIYVAYNLSNQLNGYPAKSERMAVANEVLSEVKELISIHEAANYLSVVGEYGLSASSYHYILNYYHGKEIYNNIGLNYALEAMNFTDKEYDLYLYPLEIDWETRIKKPKLDRGGDKLSPSEKTKRIELLEKALKNFQIASQMDPSYYTAHVNIVSTLSLLEREAEAIDYYVKISKSGQLVLSTGAEIGKKKLELALANAYVKSPFTQHQAIKIYEKYVKSTNKSISNIARYNLNILEKGPSTKSDEFTCLDFDGLGNYLDNVRLHRHTIDIDDTSVLEGSTDLKIEYLENSTVFQYYQDGQLLFTLQKAGQVEPIEEHVKVDTYDTNEIINSSIGYFALCRENRTVLHVGNDNELISWAKYY